MKINIHFLAFTEDTNGRLRVDVLKVDKYLHYLTLQPHSNFAMLTLAKKVLPIGKSWFTNPICLSFNDLDKKLKVGDRFTATTQFKDTEHFINTQMEPPDNCDNLKEDSEKNKEYYICLTKFNAGCKSRLGTPIFKYDDISKRYWLIGINTTPRQRPCFLKPRTYTLIHLKIKAWLTYYWNLSPPTKPSKNTCQCGKENEGGLGKDLDLNNTVGEDYAGGTNSKKHRYPWQVIHSYKTDLDFVF